MTDTELKEAGIQRKVFDQWYTLMQALWTSSIHFFKCTGNKQFFPKNEENEIVIGSIYKIDAIMCNNDFVEARLWQGEKQLAEIRYEGNPNIVCQVFFLIIKSKHFQ